MKEKIQKYIYYGVKYEDDMMYVRYGVQFFGMDKFYETIKHHGGMCPGRSEPLSAGNDFGVNCSCGGRFHMCQEVFENHCVDKKLSIDDKDHLETLLCEVMEIDRPKTFEEKAWLKL